MPGGPSRDLVRAAQSHDLLVRYIDAFGHERQASAAGIQAVLAALDPPARHLGTPTATNARVRPGALVTSPFLLVGPGTRPTFSVRVGPNVSSGALRGFLRPAVEGHPERFRELRLQLAGHQGGAGREPAELRFRLPLPLPIGDHELRLQLGDRSATLHILVAPPRLARPRGPLGRSVGLFLPLYALRSDRNWGCGDLTDLRKLGRWAGALGLAFLGTLPLFATFLDRAYDPSPYRPVSRRFWSEVFLDVEATREYRRSRSVQRWRSSAEVRREVRLLRRGAYVSFARVARLKLEALARIAEDPACWTSGRRTAFALFRRRRPEAARYAEFRARHIRWRDLRVRTTRAYELAQWLLDEQLASTVRALRRSGIRLYLDLPLGVHPEGFDVSLNPDQYARGVSIGAPPDRNHPTGQSWAILPPHPEQVRRDGYRELRASLRTLFRVAGIVRLDHVMGLHRLYWVPEGAPPSDGVYVRYRPEEAYAVIVQEAHRARAEVVGEDLGTVPPEVRPMLRRHGLLRLFVAQVEWDGRHDHVVAPPTRSLASLNTHDMDPFSTFWHKRIDPRRRGRAGSPSCPPPPWDISGTRAALRGALERLARSRADLLMVNLEDLWLEPRRQNLPGARGRGRRNFRRKARWSLEQLVRTPTIAQELRDLVAWRRERARS